MRIIAMLICGLASFTSATAQTKTTISSATPSEIDPNIRQGHLKNGLSYLVLRNTIPAKRVEIRLVLRAGIEQEDVGQKETAHLVEHIIGNYVNLGSKQTIWDWVPSWGGVVGNDFNAVTSDNSTIYKLSLPSDRPELFRDALRIQRGWAHGATFTDQDIARERKAVANELVKRIDWGLRLGDRTRYFVTGSDPALDRSFVGRSNAVRQGDPNLVRSFYRDWYRPDLETLIVVGDIDPDKVVAQIFSIFQDIPPSVGGRQPRRPIATIKPGFRYAALTDPDAPELELRIIDKRVAQNENARVPAREQVIERLAQLMIGNREKRDQTRSNSAIMLSLNSDNTSRVADDYGAGVTGFTTAFRVVDGAMHAPLEDMLAVRRSIEVYGFLPQELAEAKVEVLKQLLTSQAARTNEVLVSLLEDHVLTGSPAMAVESANALSRSLMASISVEEVNHWTRLAMNTGSRDVILTAPERLSRKLPSAATVKEWLGTAARQRAVRYQLPAPLGSVVPKSFGSYGGEVQTTEFPAIGARRLVIPSNNVTIILRPDASASTSMVSLSAWKPGGYGQYRGPDSLNARAAYLATLWNIGGVDDFDQLRLREKSIWLAPLVHEDNVEIIGGSHIEQFELFLKLFRAAFEPNVRDDRAFLAWRAHTRLTLSNSFEDGPTKLNKAIKKFFATPRPDRVELNSANISQVRYEEARRIYGELVGNPSDFIFVVEGNFDPDTIGPLVAKYLGTLPPSQPRPAVTEIEPPVPDDAGTSQTIYGGSGENASVRLFFGGHEAIPADMQPSVRAIDNILYARLRDRLREKERGTYSVNVLTDVKLRSFTTAISFDCAPDAVERLIAAVRDEVEHFLQDGPSKDEIARAVELEGTYRANRSHGVRYWKAYFARRFAEVGRSDAAFNEVIEPMPTAKSISQAAELLLKPSRFSRFILLPEKSTPKAN